MCMHTHTDMQTCAYIHTHIHTYSTHIHMYGTHTHAHTHTHTHTHTHKHIQTKQLTSKTQILNLHVFLMIFPPVVFLTKTWNSVFRTIKIQIPLWYCTAFSHACWLHDNSLSHRDSCYKPDKHSSKAQATSHIQIGQGSSRTKYAHHKKQNCSQTAHD